MYYIKVRLRASECYVEGCSAIDMCICKRKEDAEPFNTSCDAKRHAMDFGLKEEDFEIVSDTGESMVFSANEVSSEGGISLAQLQEFCAQDNADWLISQGDRIEGGYVVVNVRPEAVKIWSPKIRVNGSMDFYEALRFTSGQVCVTSVGDTDLGFKASYLELLSHDEAEQLAENYRAAGFEYWVSVEGQSEYDNSWFVTADGKLSNEYCYECMCCPGIWVDSRCLDLPCESKKPDVITFERLHEICSNGSADSKLKPGDKLENGYIVVATKPDAVKIWSSEDFITTFDWPHASNAVANYCNRWNKDGTLHIKAISAELLSKEEVETMSQSDRMTGSDYWTSTGCSSDGHWYVGYDGDLCRGEDSRNYDCCPGIWVK